VSHTKKSEELALNAKRIIDQADIEGRELTPREAGEVEELLARSREERSIEQQVKNVDGTGGVRTTLAGDGSSRYGSPGEVFVKSENFQKIADETTRGQQWTTGPVEVPHFTKAGTLLQSGQGAGLFPVPEVVPGVVETLFEQLEVADLFASSRISTSSARYIHEGTALSGAAGVAEGAEKPASDLAYSTVDEPTKKIATHLIVSDEVLDDGGLAFSRSSTVASACLSGRSWSANYCVAPGRMSWSA
jgi:HK97 family phage major capsid protein